MSKGWVKLHRKMYESEITKMPPVMRELWIYLLIKVSHAGYKNLKKGQGFFKLRDVREDLSWYSGFRKESYSTSQISKALRRLHEGNLVETTKTTNGVLVTILKYDNYQEKNNNEDNSEGHTEGTWKRYHNNKNVQELQENIVSNDTCSTAEQSNDKSTDDKSNKKSPKQLEEETKEVLKHFSRITGIEYKYKIINEKTKKAEMVWTLLKKYKPKAIIMTADYFNQKWGRDEKMCQYVRPETICRSLNKFKGYFEEAYEHKFKA